ncbi:MAG: hypothetical protein AAF621_05215 [Pseudomonadota bacterium]
MKLVEKVYGEIAPDDIRGLALDNNITEADAKNVIQALIPGILSALKAKLVTGLNEGNASDFLTVIDEFSKPHLDGQVILNRLFSNNKQALETLTERVAAFSNVDKVLAKQFVPASIAPVMTAIVKMIKKIGDESQINAASSELDDFFNIRTSNSPYEVAIKAANDFIGSVFGGEVEKKMQAENIDRITPQNNLVYTLLDLFDQDNDGSVMDDIYHMLVK